MGGSGLGSCIKFCVCSCHLFFDLGAFLDMTSAVSLQQSHLGSNGLSPVEALSLSLPGKNFLLSVFMFAEFTLCKAVALCANGQWCFPWKLAWQILIPSHVMRFFWVCIDHLAADKHDLCFDFILSGLKHIILQSYQTHSWLLYLSMANDVSIAFGVPLVWMLTQPGASGKCRWRTSSHETNFYKRPLEMHATWISFILQEPFLPQLPSHPLVEPQFFWNVMWRPKQSLIIPLPCLERTSYSWSSLCNLNQGDLPLRFQAVNLLASRSRTKPRLDCSENRSEVTTNLPNWSPWSETGYSMDNWQSCLKVFGRNQQAKSPRAVCALPEQTFCSVHHSASGCLHWHSKCLASDEPPDFRASTSACKRLASDRAASSSLANIICQSAGICGIRYINSHIKETDYVLHIATLYPKNCSLLCMVLLLTLNLPATPLGLNIKMHMFGRQTKTRIPTTWDWKVTTLRH